MSRAFQWPLQTIRSKNLVSKWLTRLNIENGMRWLLLQFGKQLFEASNRTKFDSNELQSVPKWYKFNRFTMEIMGSMQWHQNGGYKTKQIQSKEGGRAGFFSIDGISYCDSLQFEFVRHDAQRWRREHVELLHNNKIYLSCNAWQNTNISFISGQNVLQDQIWTFIFIHFWWEMSIHFRSLCLIIKDYKQRVPREWVTASSQRILPSRWWKFAAVSLNEDLERSTSCDGLQWRIQEYITL